jgi:polar amino acid transport system permease protein
MTQFLDLWVQYAPLMLAGLVTTAWICALATVLGIVIGLILACLEGLDAKPLRWAVRTYIEIMRGLPILILLFVL